MSQRTHRRDFLKQSATIGAGLWVVGSGSDLLAGSANDKVNVAIIGVGGRGGAHVEAIPEAGGNIVALCDVDDRHLHGAAEKHPKAAKYHDFRKMLDEMGQQIDAVVVSTPDHTHAVAANLAMKMGKHCYCEKPLTRSIHEARTLTETAARMKVATQMGNQGQSGDNTRRIVEIVRSGAIGPVKEVHAWTNRPIWPQGEDRPEGSDPVPDYLDWDLWLGPAPHRPFVANKPLPDTKDRKGRTRKNEKKIYHPFAWRGWWDFGTGALGDMACHIVNAAYWALDLKYPTTVEVVDGEPRKPESAPKWEILRYRFPARGEMPPLSFTWYDGGKRPPRELIEGEEMKEGGSLLIGEKGKIYVPHDYGGQHILLPKKDFEGYEPPPPTLARSPGHHKDFLEACKDPVGRKACSDFSYSGPLTEMVLLGVVAFRTGKTLEWDGPNMKATNGSEADEFIRPEYRKEWSL